MKKRAICPRELAVGFSGTAVMDNDEFKEDTLTVKTAVSILWQTIWNHRLVKQISLLYKMLISFKTNITQNKLNAFAAGVFGFNYWPQ